MKTDYVIQPEGEVDVEFIDMVAAARDYGLENGLDPEEVAYVLLVFGYGVFSIDEVKSAHGPVCPDCGRDIGSVSLSGLGEEADVEPCGCVVKLDSLPDEVLEDILKQ